MTMEVRIVYSFVLFYWAVLDKRGNEVEWGMSYDDAKNHAEQKGFKVVD